MLTIAVCDDEFTQREITMALIRDYLKSRPDLTAKVSLFATGADLLDAVDETGGFSLYIMDIIMPKSSGLETAFKLRELGDGGAIIYLTTSPDYAVDSYLTDAFFYLLKPVNSSRFFDTLDKAAAAWEKRQTEGVTVSTPDGVRRIKLDNILYVERADRSTRYYLTGGEVVNSRKLHVSFQEALSPLLTDRRFMLCGASFVINLHHVAAVEKNDVLLDSGGRVPISRAVLAQVKKAWVNYWLEGDVLEC